MDSIFEIENNFELVLEFFGGFWALGKFAFSSRPCGFIFSRLAA